MASELIVKIRLQTESKRDKRKVDGLPRIGQYGVEQIRQRIIDKKITASGATQGSLQYKIDGEKALRIIALGGERAPIRTLQYGREGGKMPPVAKIKEWIVAKRLTIIPIPYKRKPSPKWTPKFTPQERGLNARAWAIAIGIKMNGTKRHQENDLQVYSPVLEEVVSLFKEFILNKEAENLRKNIMQ